MAQGLLDDQQAEKPGADEQREIKALKKRESDSLVSPDQAAELEQHFNAPAADEPVYSTAGNEPSDTKGEGAKNDKSPTSDDLKKAEAKPESENSLGRSSSAEDLSAKGSQHENQVGRGYKKGIENKLNQSQAVRRYVIFGGIGAALITLIVILFSFLNVFKLDGLMSNIEQKAFLRHNASLNTRSSKYISSYIEARMLQWGDSTDTSKDTLFRSKKVDTNSPFTDWYRTMRASNFEQDVFEKHGIKFTSAVGANGQPKLGKIDINGQKPINVSIPAADLAGIENGNVDVLNKYQDFFNLEKFDTNKQARQAIKDVVNANTHWTDVYKRRFLRRSIQNMTGVRDWRFFETTRDKITDKKVDIRNRILNNVLPDDTLMSQVVRCLYGLTQCKPNADVASPEDRISTANLQESTNPSSNNATETANEDKLAAESAQLDAAGISDALKKVLSAANIFTKILNIPSTLDMLSYINKNVGNLTKLVVVARGAQAAGLFQVFETSRDQIKTGQVSGDEVNAFMQNIDTAASSAGWSQVISGNSGNAPGTTQTGGQCTQDAQALQEKDSQAYLKKYKTDYAPLCADQQIGSASNAQQLQTAYKATIGNVVGPIVGAWGGLKSTPIIGNLIGLVEWFGNLLGNATNLLVTSVLSALGLDKDVHAAIAWVFAKTSSFLGITILKGYESAGTMFNWLLQGGAYSAESASRQEGAALTNPGSQAAAQSTIAQYQTDQRNQTSLYGQVASLDNPDSLAFKGATALSNVQSDPSTAIMSGLHGMWSSMSKNFGSIFSGHLYAVTPNGYAASQFAGIQTYDYPQQCYNLDPITARPTSGTNALDLFANPIKYGVNHIPFQVSDKWSAVLNSWDGERNSDKFYQAIYGVLSDNSITDNADDTAIHIYNCNLLDTAVRGSLGYLYGYNADAASQVIDSSTPPAGTP